jgi:WD40 repeat protein
MPNAQSVLPPQCQLVIRHADELVSGIRWSPCGRYLTFASGSLIVFAWELESGECISMLTGHDDPVHDLAWSPDGTCIAMLSFESVYLYNYAQQRVTATLASGPGAEFNGFAWSPDGRLVALSEQRQPGGGVLRVWEAGSEEAGWECPGRQPGDFEQALDPLAWTSDLAVVSARQDGALEVWDPQSGKARQVYGGHRGRIAAVAGSPAGAPGGPYVASTAEDGRLHVWRALTGEVCYTYCGTHARRPVAWSPDGARIAFPDDGGAVRIVDVARGATVGAYTGHEGQVCSLAWSPGGACIASAEEERHEVRVWRPAQYAA